MPRGGKRPGAGRKKGSNDNKPIGAISSSEQHSNKVGLQREASSNENSSGVGSDERISSGQKEEVNEGPISDNSMLSGGTTIQGYNEVSIHGDSGSLDNSSEARSLGERILGGSAIQSESKEIKEPDSQGLSIGSELRGQEIKDSDISQIKEPEIKESKVEESNENGVNESSSPVSVPKGQPNGEPQSDAYRQETQPKAKGKRRGKPELGEDGLKLLETISQSIRERGLSEGICAPSRNGEDDRHGSQSNESSLPESSPGCADQHPKQSSQQPDNSGSKQNSQNAGVNPDIAKLFDPAIYCSFYFGESPEWKYSSKQLEFIRACRVVREDLTLDLSEFPRNIALGAVNGAGKTQIIGKLIRYFMDTIPGCGVGFSSHVQRQCEALERYLNQHQLQPRFESWKCVQGKLEAPNGNWARWFTAKDVGAVESLHAPFMIRILDEVKSMKDEIIDATNRWQPKLTIFISSKGLMSGRFYDCFTSLRPFWQTHEINASDCPWIAPKWIEEQIATHGINSALVKSMITNEFSDVDLKVMITIEAVNDILRHPPMHENDGIVKAGLDVSAAKRDGDECVLIHGTGNKVETPWSCPPSDNVMEVVGRVMNRIREVRPHHLFIDAGGAGSPVADMIHGIIKEEKGRTQVHRVNFGGTALNKIKYRLRNAEMLGIVAQKIAERKIILPNHPKLIGQLTTRQYTPNMSGQIVLESKATLKIRTGGSPDYADALCLWACEPPAESHSKTVNHFDKNRLREIQSNKMNGSHVGSRFLGNG